MKTFWTENDKKLLLEYSKIYSLKETAEKMNRSFYSVQSKGRNLSIKFGKQKPSIKIGDRFNHLELIEEPYLSKLGNQNHRFGMFKCDCGVIKEFQVDLVKRGKTKSCGCNRKKAP